MLTDARCKRFWRFVKQHLAEMNLVEWEIRTFVKDHNPENSEDELTLAQVQSNPKFLVAAMTLFRDWGEAIPKVKDIERTASHECLHILFSKLMDLAMDRHATDEALQEEEHNVIRRLLAWKGLN